MKYYNQIVEIHPSSVSGVIQAPPSKSVTQRLFALALLHPGKTLLNGFGESKDEMAALQIIRQLGARVQMHSHTSVSIEGSPWLRKIPDLPEALTLECGESGLSMRMFTSIAALFNFPITLQASGSLQRRPMHFFESVLPQLGIKIKTGNGFPPISLQGPLVADSVEIDGSLSSQFISGLFIALAKSTKQPLTVSVSNLKSRPYIELTLHLMREFGYKLSALDKDRFQIFPSEIHSNPQHFDVEGDWSGAAFLMVAAALHGEVAIQKLNRNSFQADREILNVLRKAGTSLHFSADSISIQQSTHEAFLFDATDCPDLFPPLVVLALGCKGISEIRGVHRLIHKESNRAEALQTELKKMGGEIEIVGDALRIQGPQKLRGATVEAHNDHRIAMALAIAALGAEGSSRICGAESVSKSYPAFFEDLKQLGVALRIIQ